MRRRLILGLALMLSSVVHAAGHEPLLPTPDVPDYVVTMAGRSAHATHDTVYTVTHRGGWTRVDRHDPGTISTEHYHRSCSPYPRYTRDRQTGAYINVAIERCHRRAGWDYNPERTEKQQTFLGEQCTVWTAWRSEIIVRTPMVRTSCVTDDGIEVWYVVSGDYGLLSWAEATKIERRAEAREEAEPPADLLKIDGWFADVPASAQRETPDFELVMEQEGKPEFVRVIKRRGNWRREDEWFASVRQQFSVANPAAGYSLGLYNLPTDTPLLVFNQRSSLSPAEAVVEAAGSRRMDRPYETVLGERCVWLDMAPNMADASHYECRSGDGIALKIEQGSRTLRRVLMATKLERRAIAMDEIKPPVELIERKTWRLPD